MPSLPAPARARAPRRGETGDRPIASGLNLDPRHVNIIDESHQRCAALGLSRIERPDLGLLGRSDLAVARDRNLRLHAHAAPVMELLYDQIVNTESMVVLTDAAGTIIHAIGDDDFLSRASKVALQPGAVWSEAQKGTNAVGTALMDEVPTLVHADEHYFHANQFLTCSAAPILDPRGNILGVLDVSGDHRSYHQHTMALVKMSARMIENHWLNDDYRSVMRLHFHGRVDFIGTLMEGIIAVKPDGHIVGANRGALEQLRMSGATLRMQTLESLFGTKVGALVDRFRSPLATPMTVQASVGHSLHLHARFDWPVWTSLAEAVAAQVPGAVITAPALHAASIDALVGSVRPPKPAVGTEFDATPPATAPAPAATIDAQAAAVVERLRLALEHGIPILVHGETGTGKEWLARAAHGTVRPGSPFLIVGCTSLAPADLDASFSSHELGVPGDGTLFLDEVGDLAKAAQLRLLRLIDQQNMPTARGSKTRTTVICASRENLRTLVDLGSFREDLFYRLNGMSVRLPALRQRSDLMALANSIVERESPGGTRELSADVMQLLLHYRWPGNLRQLFNVLRAAVVLSAGETLITRCHLPDDVVEEALAAQSNALCDRKPVDAAPNAGCDAAARSLEAIERDVIRRAVDAAKGNITVASKSLGISRNTIYRKLRWNERH